MNAYFFHIKNVLSPYLLVAALFIVSCTQKSNEKNKAEDKDAFPHDKYISLILSMDTMLPSARRSLVEAEIKKLTTNPDKDAEAYLHYFKYLHLRKDNQPDSAIAELNAIDSTGEHNELWQIRKYNLLLEKVGSASVESSLMSELINATHVADKVKSRATYFFYDLLAKAYYQNKNAVKSLEYAELYFTHHPFQNHAIVMQRYYDISFLLAAKMNDTYKMAQFSNKAKTLAEKIGDSMAIARSYDYEAQVFSSQMQFEKALSSSKKYYAYLKGKNALDVISYNNLSKSFLSTGETDSAIFYYKEALKIVNKMEPGKKNSMIYNGLFDAYTRKKDYANALQAADSAYTIDLRNIRNIEEEKIAELHEKYQAEKKDRNIAELKSSNLLSRKIINQQRWIFAALLVIITGILFIVWSVYRQRLLKSRNELLQVENRRLKTEQKMLQAQLNPHFVFNAIANLQSLIGSGETQLSISYLSAFSQMLRNILEQSRKDFISIEEEIETLQNYLSLQQMRFSNIFDFEIKPDDSIDAGTMLIPPMVIQPFLENAIEHGFRNIDYKGKLVTTFTAEAGRLLINIEDNGSGIVKQEQPAAGKTSLSGIIIRERLQALFNTEEKQSAGFTLTDKVTEGGQGILIKINMPLTQE